MKWIDLGLPSGTLWAEQNENGYYDEYRAQKKFLKSLPRKEDFFELIKHCWKRWDPERIGLEFMGPNGAKLFFPALGIKYRREVYDIDTLGAYYAYGEMQEGSQYIMIFGMYGEAVQPMSSEYKVCVRLVKRGGEQ